MFNEFLKIINCCKPKDELDKFIIKEENLGLSTNELTEKNKLFNYIILVFSIYEKNLIMYKDFIINI